jgi:hypothetical protein
MFKTIFTSAVVIFTSVPSAFAASPAVATTITATPYGRFGCLQRAMNKFYAIGATGMTSDSDSVWGYINNNATIGVWCRGSEAIIITAGDNSVNLRNEIRSSL